MNSRDRFIATISAASAGGILTAIIWSAGNVQRQEKANFASGRSIDAEAGYSGNIAPGNPESAGVAAGKKILGVEAPTAESSPILPLRRENRHSDNDSGQLTGGAYKGTLPPPAFQPPRNGTPRIAPSEPRSATASVNAPRSLNVSPTDVPLYGFRLTRDAEGLDIAFDQRSQIPVIFAPALDEQVDAGTLGSGVVGRTSQDPQQGLARGAEEVEERITDDFIRAVSPGDRERPPTLREWDEAASLADERYQVFLGDVAFMAASRELARQFE